MLYFVEITCVIVELWLIHLFLSSMYQGTYFSKSATIASYLMFGLIITYLSLNAKMEFLRITFTLLGVCFLSIFIFNAKFLQGFLSALTICALVAISDVSLTLMMTYCGVDVSILTTDILARSLYLIIGHVLLFSLIFCVCLINRPAKDPMNIKSLLLVSPCWVISITLCLLLAWQLFITQISIHPLYLFVLLGLLYTNLVIIYYTNKINKQAQEKIQFEMAEHHFKLQQTYYDQLRAQHEDIRALWHDIAKYIRAAQIETVSEAMTQANEMLNAVISVVDVNNPVVSAILNEYHHSAKKLDITLLLDVQIPPKLFVTAADLYVLIGNTMDNAIEACSEMPLEQRVISLSLKTHNDMLFFDIQNPYLDTHKKQYRGNTHGYGLKNVSRCIEKYRGTLDTNNENGIFRVTAHLNRQ